MATLQLVGLKKSFGATHVLHGVDLALADGEMLAIVGASGCGKSTLLRLVAGLEQPSAGEIILDGRDISRVDPARRDIAMVFQNYALYPHMTVFANMAYALKIRGMASAEIRRRVEETARSLGLEALLGRRPAQLSGGQRQRVAMGRAVVRDPKLFLFDEPLSNLDAKLRIQVRAEIKSLQRRLGVTSLFVTHDQTEAMTLGDRLMVLNQGHVAQLGTPLEIYDNPADSYVATFIGAPTMNLLSATLAEGGAAARLDAGPSIALHGPIEGADGDRLTIGIRPEQIVPAEGGVVLAIDLVEPLGSETLVHGLLANGERLSVKLPGNHLPTHTLAVDLRASRHHVFDQVGRRIVGVPRSEDL